jgi:hypothetical protein
MGKHTKHSDRTRQSAWRHERTYSETYRTLSGFRRAEARELKRQLLYLVMRTDPATLPPPLRDLRERHDALLDQAERYDGDADRYRREEERRRDLRRGRRPRWSFDRRWEDANLSSTQHLEHVSNAIQDARERKSKKQRHR